MIFGDSVRAAASPDPAEWIAGSVDSAGGTVGSLVPDLYESLLRVHAPEPGPDDWWGRYRGVFDIIASVGRRHTSTREDAWFTIWEGHGFGTSSAHIAWASPPEDHAERQRREAERERVRGANTEHNASVQRELASIPTFDMPDRRHYLLHGPLTALAGLQHPDDERWQNPDLMWPDDRAWFVATDVDFWSLFVGGTSALTTELADSATTPTEIIDRGHPLPIEI